MFQGETTEYLVHVVTGSRKFAGTDSNIYMSIAGKTVLFFIKKVFFFFFKKIKYIPVTQKIKTILIKAKLEINI